MNQTRKIRENERVLIEFMLEKIGFTTQDYPICEDVFEYEGGKMGSISLGVDNNPDDYDVDLIQVQYADSDNITVIITLTKNKRNQLLDLDFWKEDFSKLILYPTPDKVVVKEIL
ncbi:MAG: hypothetical protein U5N85_07150 [Arcicella sp.]|nr:hypothetical protein [Arcicella sp.]